MRGRGDALVVPQTAQRRFLAYGLPGFCARGINSCVAQHNAAMASRDEINVAISDCLDQCDAHCRPLDCLTEYVSNLVHKDGWRLSHANEVGSKALRILKILLEPSEN